MERSIIKRICVTGLCMALIWTVLTGCGSKNVAEETDSAGNQTEDRITDVSEETNLSEEADSSDGVLADTPGEAEEETVNEGQTTEAENGISDADYCAQQFQGVKRTMPYKLYAEHNPVMTQTFGADPYALVYEDTVYLYMTGDVLESSGGVVSSNTYGKINTIRVLKSKDLVNWTDCGEIPVAGSRGIATWANNSWAPAVCMKNVDGKDQFFLYFANGGSGIGVLVADHPEGPYRDPLKQPLVTWSTPGIAGVVWLFDPAVLVDEDGTGYLYFGGGVPEGKAADPGTIRVVRLADDMIHLDGEARQVNVPYVFEDSGINRIGDTYYYSYCSNWNVPSQSETGLPIESAQICYMTSTSPYGPFELQGSILRNPGDYFGVWGNNHHCLFEFKGQYYITYHSQILEKKMGYEGKGYRCTHIDQLNVKEDGTLKSFGTTTGVEQVCNFSLDGVVEAETMSTMAGIEVKKVLDSSHAAGARRVVSAIDSGDFLYLSNVDFADGKTRFTLTASAGEEEGIVEIRLDSIGGPVVGYVRIPGGTEGYYDYECELFETVTGVHNLLFTFCGEGFTLDAWIFR